MFAARSEYLFLISIACGLAACSSEPGTPAPAASADVNAAMSGKLANAGTGTLALTVAGASTSAAVATSGAGAGAAAPSSNGAGAGGTSGSAGALPSSSAGAAASGGATFTEVFNLLAGGCASGGYCHAAGGGLSKLELVDQAKAYTDLVGVTAMGMTMPGTATMGCSTSMIMRVKASDPDNSLLMQKLRGNQTCGAAMPPNGMLRPNELQLVHDWIAAGAKND